MDELEHSGTLLMKWGERRYQYKDGTYTPLGRIHYGIGPPRDPSQKERYYKDLKKLKPKDFKDDPQAEARYVKALKQLDYYESYKARQKTQNAALEKQAAKDFDGDSRAQDTKIYNEGTDRNFQKNSSPNSDVDAREAANAKMPFKSVKEMSDADLIAGINRSRLEQQYREAQHPVLSAGRRFVGLAAEKAVPAATDALVKTGSKYLEKKLTEALGLTDKNADVLAKLKYQVDVADYKRQLKNLSEGHTKDWVAKDKTETEKLNEATAYEIAKREYENVKNGKAKDYEAIPAEWYFLDDKELDERIKREGKYRQLSDLTIGKRNKDKSGNK